MVSKPAITYQQADLVHLPIKYERQQVQQLFYDLSRKLYGSYQSLAFNLGNIEMFTVYGTGGSSRLQLMPDRFRIIEQNSGVKLDDFKARFEVTMASAANVFGLSKFALQTIKLRSVSQPLLWEDATEFLAKQICKFEDDDIETFDRRPTAFTMNFVFLATSEEPYTFNVKIESHDQPAKPVTMDVDGNFSGTKDEEGNYTGTISADDLMAAAGNIQTTYDFVSENVMGFLNRYDSPDT